MKLLLFLFLVNILFCCSAFAQRSQPSPLGAERVMDRQQAFLEQRTFPFDSLPTSLIKNMYVKTKATNNSYLQSSYNWQEIGPFSIAGRMTDITVLPSNRRYWITSAAAGGVWKSDSAGLAWQKTNVANIPTFATGAIAVNPFNPSEWLVGTGEPNFAHNNYPGVGVFISIDSGASWQPRGADFLQGSIAEIVYHPSDSGLVFAACAGFGGFPGIYRSRNGGETWSLTLGGASAMDVVISPLQPNIVFASLSFPFGDSLNGIYRSLDTGRTWTRLQQGLPNSHGRAVIALTPAQQGLVYVFMSNTQGGTNNAGLFRSTDNGNTFTRIDSAPADIFGTAQVGQGWYDIAVAVSPTNPQEVVIGGVTLHRTLNAGTSWQQIQPIHVDIHALRYISSDSLLAAHDGGISLIINGLPRDRVNNLVTTQFYDISVPMQSSLTGGTQDNGILIRRGVQWVQPVGGDIVAVQRFSQFPRVGVLATSFGNLFRTTDSGNTWSAANNGIQIQEPADWETPLVKGNGDTLLYARTRVYRSATLAASWEAISPVLAGNNIPITAIAQSPELGRVLFAAAKNGSVFRTLNNGISWQDVSSGLPFRVPTSLAGNPQKREHFAVTFSGFGAPHVWITENAGNSWRDVSGNLPDVPVNCFLYDRVSPFTTWFVGTDLGAYCTFDAGKTWLPMMQGMGIAPVLDLEFDAAGTLYAATYGRGIFSLQPTSLPVELTEFTAFRSGGNSVLLEWQTASEQQNSHFLIERADSIPVSPFRVLGKIQGGNTSTSLRRYSFLDTLAPRSVLRYRLRQVDNDGTEQLSNEVEVAEVVSFLELESKYFPNPFDRLLTIQYSLRSSSSVNIAVFSSVGVKIRDILSMKYHNRGTFSVSWDGTSSSGESVASGVYFIVFETQHQKMVTPILKL